MGSATRGAASLIGALALTFAVQVPALADTYLHVDARHDVERSPQGVPAPHYRQADVTRVRINHSDTSIRFAVRLRSSSLRHLRFRVLGFTLKTPSDTYSGDWIAEHGTAQYDLYNGRGNPMSCAESSGRNGHTIWLTLDRACFGSPRWVRASVGVGTNDGTLAWGDNPLSNDWRRTYDDVFSPRIHAGS